MRRPHPIPPSEQIRSKGRARHPAAYLAAASRDELAHMQYVAARAPEQELSCLLGSDRSRQQTVPPRFKKGPRPRPRRLHGEDMLVPFVHKWVPPLLDKPGHKTDVPSRRFDRDRGSILIQLKLDRLHRWSLHCDASSLVKRAIGGQRSDAGSDKPVSALGQP